MKAVIKSDLLYKSLKQMSPAIRKNVVLPITAGVLMKFKKDSLTLVGTDTDTWCIVNIDCDCSDEFSIAVDYNKLSEVCSNFSTPLSLSSDGKVLSISTGKYKNSLSLFDGVEHFPVPKDASFDFDIEVDGDFFHALSNANSCKHKDSLRVSLNEACIDIMRTHINIVGTDTSILYLKTLEVKSPKEQSCMTSENFVQLTKLFQESTLSVGASFIKAKYKELTVVSKLKEQQYAGYKLIIPSELKHNICFDKEEVKTSLNRISVAFSLSKYCQLNFSPDLVSFKAFNIDSGDEAVDDMEVEHKVEIEAIGVNGGQLMHLMNIIEGSKINMMFTGESKTIYMQPEGDDSVLCLIQPLLLQTNK